MPVPHVTIAEFVGLGAAGQQANKQIDVAAVTSALEKANAMSLIDRLDKGIWTRLGPVSYLHPNKRMLVSDN